MEERTADSVFKQLQLRNGDAIAFGELLDVKACGVPQRPEAFTVGGLPECVPLCHGDFLKTGALYCAKVICAPFTALSSEGD
jgi:hypothetical protein